MKIHGAFLDTAPVPKTAKILLVHEPQCIFMSFDKAAP